jgi:hypothetical protein
MVIEKSIETTDKRGLGFHYSSDIHYDEIDSKILWSEFLFFTPVGPETDGNGDKFFTVQSGEILIERETIDKIFSLIVTVDRIEYIEHYIDALTKTKLTIAIDGTVTPVKTIYIEDSIFNPGNRIILGNEKEYIVESIDQVSNSITVEGPGIEEAHGVGVVVEIAPIRIGFEGDIIASGFIPADPTKDIHIYYMKVLQNE